MPRFRGAAASASALNVTGTRMEDRKCHMAKDDSSSPPSLDDLDVRLRAARAASRPNESRPSHKTVPSSLAGLAMRAGIELVVGVGVGVAVGYGFDQWLDTSPVLLIVGFVLGAAAGMLNVYRAISGLGMAAGYRPASDEKTPRPGRG